MKKQRKNVRSPEDAIKFVNGSIITLQKLADIYDEGHFDISRELATTIMRLVCEELHQTKLRRDLKFVSYTFQPDPRNLVPQFLATGLMKKLPPEIEGSKTLVTHIPLTDYEAELDGRLRKLKFSEWWSGLVAVSGSGPNGIIVLNKEKQIPYEKREKISRYGIVKAFRNRVGAHLEETESNEETLAYDKMKVFELMHEWSTGQSFSSSITPEYFEYQNSFGQAAIRHIAFELLKSAEQWESLYGLSDRV